jgi:phosphoribosylformylglycinamidine synthase
MTFFHLYRTPALSNYQAANLLEAARGAVSRNIQNIDTEFCFNIASSAPLTTDEEQLLRWLLAETFEPENLSSTSFLARPATTGSTPVVLEVGPRMNFTSAWSTNAVSICQACCLGSIRRIERSRRYRLSIHGGTLGRHELDAFLALVHDRMTECPYPEPLRSFEAGIKPEPVKIVPLLEEGRTALERINREMGLGMDDWDLDYYTNLFVKDIGRNPTNVECFDLSQSNSEHSRHWFFRGRMVVDGREVPGTLMKIVKDTYEANRNNSVIAFSDNSSAISGYELATIIPGRIGKPSPLAESKRTYNIIFTAETHNFPSGVAPFPGAETGTGGRIRDVQATGTAGLVVAGTAAYCVGNLHIPGYVLPWEDRSWAYPGNLASPLRIEVEASNGASDYGNKFGEPVIQGFTRSFGLRLLTASGASG